MASCSQQAPDQDLTENVERQNSNKKLNRRSRQTSMKKETKKASTSSSPIVKIQKSNLTTTAATTSTIRSLKSCNCKYNEKQKESEMEKLRRHLQRCQNELREEVEKRGTSSSSRAASDRDRDRLLNEVKQLGVSKRRLESALEAANVAVKRKNQEVRSVREACKQEVANLEKASALEIKKLLEDLKTKDQMLASLDRNQYSDRSVQLKIVQQKQQQAQQQQLQQQVQQQLQQQREEIEQQTKKKLQEQQEKFQQQLKEQQLRIEEKIKEDSNRGVHRKDHQTSQMISLKSEIASLEAQIHSMIIEKDKILIEKEKISQQNVKIMEEKRCLESKMDALKGENDKMAQTLSQLQEEVMNLNESLAESNVEGVLQQFEELKDITAEQKRTIEKLEEKIKKQKSHKNKSSSNAEQKHKKNVTFMLPDSTEPIVNGRIAYKEDMRFLFFGDEEEEEEVEKKKVEKWNDGKIDRHSKGNQENDEYKGIISSQKPQHCSTEDYSVLMNEHLRLQEAYADLSEKRSKEWSIERESLNLAIIALEGKNQEYENMVKTLVLQVEETNDKNEELEFQVLELEGNRCDTKLVEEKERQMEEAEKKNSLLMERMEELNEALIVGSQLKSAKEPVEAGVQCLLIENLKGDVCLDGCDELGGGIISLGLSSAATTTTTSTSGIEDIPSDDEVSVDSMPADHEAESNADLTSSFEENPTNEENSLEASKTEKSMKIIENLELRLACSKLRENNLLDKIALLCEEKKRLIQDYDTYKEDEMMVDEYKAYEKNLNEIGCSVDAEATDDLINEESAKEETKEEEVEVEEGDEVDPKRVAAKLKLNLNLTLENRPSIDDCLRLDTPTKAGRTYPEYIQSLTGEDESEVLQQKMSQLEKDCETLREIVDMDENVIRELQIKLLDLESSEKSLQSVVDKLEGVEKILRKSRGETEDENEKLKRELVRSKSLEETLQSNLDISKSNEKQLRKQLEELSQDLKEVEQKLKKKCLLVEKLQKSSTESSEKFEDQLGELESVIELFKKRNTNLEKLCEDLNCKLMDSEKQTKRYKLHSECMEQQRDTFVFRIQSLEKDRVSILEKINLLNKCVEEKSNQLELSAAESRGLRMCLEACENQKEDLTLKVERQKDVELLVMGEMDNLREENFKLRENLKRAVQDRKVISKHRESQTSFDDLYQEEFSEHYNEYENDEMKVTFTLNVNDDNNPGDSPISSGLLFLDQDKSLRGRTLPIRLPGRRTKSLNDLNIFEVHRKHKITQTTSPFGGLKNVSSMIPISKVYTNQNLTCFNILSQPPSLLQTTNHSNFDGFLYSHPSRLVNRTNRMDSSQ